MNATPNFKRAIHNLPTREQRISLRRMVEIKREFTELIVFQGADVNQLKSLSEEFDYHKNQLLTQTNDRLITRLKEIMKNVI